MPRITLTQCTKSKLDIATRRSLIKAFLKERIQFDPIEKIALRTEQDNHDNTLILIARLPGAQDEIVGFAEISFFDQQAQIRRFVVSSQCQNLGIGGQLLLRAAEKAITRNIKRISVICNDSQKGFFVKKGFVTREKILPGNSSEFLSRLENPAPEMLLIRSPKAQAQPVNTETRAPRILPLPQTRKLLGKDTDTYHFRTEADYLDLHRSMLTQARRKIWILTHALSCKVLSDPTTSEALLNLIKSNPQAEIRILLDNDRAGAGYYNPTINLAQRLSSHIEVRTTPITSARLKESFSLIDNTSAIHRKTLTDYFGMANYHSRLLYERLHNEYLQHWQFARPSLHLRRLAI